MTIPLKTIGSKTTNTGLYGRLKSGITEMGLELDGLPLDAYLAYLKLLSEWNCAYNLTAIREPGKMLSYHVLDSLSILPYIHGRYCLDVGSGAGLPGIILALAQPDTYWVLLDSNVKKIRFINQAVLSLDLQNVDVVHCRFEHYQSAKLFSSIVSRALYSLVKFLDDGRHLLSPKGHLLAMKGADLNSEISALHNCKSAIYPLQVPGVTSGRSLVKLIPSQ